MENPFPSKNCSTDAVLIPLVLDGARFGGRGVPLLIRSCRPSASRTLCVQDFQPIVRRSVSWPLLIVRPGPPHA